MTTEKNNYTNLFDLSSVGSGFKTILFITLCLLFVLITLGGIVRVTDSGLGCPDWPLCYGQFIPPLEDVTYAGDYSNMINAAKHLFNLNLQVGDENTSTRMGQLLDDISGASVNMGENVSSINVPLRLHSGDRLAIRIVYKPANATFSPNNASISNRSYKVFIKL